MERTARRYLSGVIWETYLYILTSKEPVGVRDVWRELKLSSPSLAQYHINNLLEMKLLAQTEEGRYVAEEKAKLDVLRSFVLLRGRLVSRMTFYAAFILGILVTYFGFWPLRWSFQDLTVIIVCAFSIFAFLYEAYEQHKGLRADVQKV